LTFAAFDTVDRDLLVFRFERHFGLLQWVRLYLSDRSFMVVLGSIVVHLLCSIPHVSVLDPCVFTAYMAHLADFVADDSNLRSLSTK